MSGKIIRIQAILYENVKIQITTNEGQTRDIGVRNEVLQGDVLSPLLFAIHLHDFEDSLMQEGFEGVNLNARHHVISLAYAADITMAKSI